MNPSETESSDPVDSPPSLPVPPSCAIDFSFADELLSPEDEHPHRQFSSTSQHQTDGGGMYMSTSVVNRSLENILLDAVSMDESIDLGSGADLGGKADAAELELGGDDFEPKTGRYDDSTPNQEATEVVHYNQMVPESLPGFSDVGRDSVLSNKECVLEIATVDDVENKDVQTLDGSHKVTATSTVTTEFQTTEQDVLENVRTVNPSLSAEHPDVLDEGRDRHGSISLTPKIVVDEAVEVDFSTDIKANPSVLTPADSSKSLIKFFTAGGAETGGTDVEGKNFFDSFSTGNEEQEQSLGSGAPVTVSPGVSVTEGPAQHYWAPILVGTVTGHQSTVYPSSTVSPEVPSDVPVSVRGELSQTHVTNPPEGVIQQADLAVQQPVHKTHTVRSADASIGVHFSADTVSFQFHEPQLELGWSAVSPVVSGDAGDADAVVNGNRYYDAWIPSESTARDLATALTGTPMVAIATHLSRPGVVLQEMLGDPVYDLVLRSVGEQEANKRLVRNADSVPQDDVGLRQLIISDCLRSAIDLTCRLLSQCGQGPGKLGQPSHHTPYSLQLWFTRLALMIKLRLYTQAESEFEPFGNLESPDLFYEFHQNTFPLRRGSMVPFEMRVLHAELPQFLGRSQEALDRLYHLESITNKILSNVTSGVAEDGSVATFGSASLTASVDVWKSRHVRILYSIGSCLLGIKDYGSAAQIYGQLLDEDEQNKSHLYNGLGRINLQMGDITTASKYFEISEKYISDPESTAAKCQAFMNRGFLALGNNQFSDAYKLFKEAVDLDGNNVMAVNNMAVCSLYLGKLKGALHALETLVYADPRRNLQEPIVLNLCTLYELESSKAVQKKHRLLDLISQHKGNAFNIASLKMA